MSALEICINLFSYGVFMLGTLLIWPSRRNFIAWLAFPFFVVAYLIPLLAIDYGAIARADVLSKLTLINLLGAVSMVVGLFIGERIKIKFPWRPILQRVRSGIGPDDVVQRTFNVMFAACLLMTLCFLWMRMVPMFAEEPFVAKFFRGPYKEKYDQVSVFYRLSQAVMMTALPLAMVLFINLRIKKLFLPVVWAVLLFAVALTRSLVGAGAVILIMAWASGTRLRFFVFLFTSTLIYCVGNIAYVILGISGPSDFNILEEIASGASDILDHLVFLDAFDSSRDLTYGLTFVGGLIPGNFIYNPSVFTLAIANGTNDVSELASGGYRLPVSIAGFVAFSWAGAIIVPMLSGAIYGFFIAILKKIEIKNLSQHVAVIIWFQVWASFWTDFYFFTYSKVISIGIFMYLVPNIYLLARLQLKKRKRTNTKSKNRLESKQAVGQPIFDVK